MKQMTMLIGLALLSGCSPSQSSDSVDFLVAHPDRLREVERQCDSDHAKMGAAECNAASEARHRLFMGNGKPVYTPSKEPPKF
ncbi:hypothetical protein ASG87_03740 [Frateuria sp. Soil773]|uniref:EexN family lipoprotein n=1 Tax=Frateuria sp. Soil773 TaxID=1736407 RepID=UPI0006F75E6E|nr:EexN family lipoprotein [Frateuria sp. Soil773]KRE89456.1 hypothetical protein ASG87_03740 [Frateuria sp. Soil773]